MELEYLLGSHRVITKIKESRSEEEAGRAFGLMEAPLKTQVAYVSHLKDVS